MRKLVLNLIVFGLVVVLSGCEEKKTYLYYMQHPLVLEKAAQACQTDQKTSSQENDCQIVFHAASKIMSLLQEQQADPEKFGERIMDNQMIYANKYQAVLQAQQTFNQVKKNHAKTTALRTAEDDLYKAKKALFNQREEVAVLLAVVGLSSPG
jgi:hypothetical protein